MMYLLELGKAILGPQPGATLLLFILFGVAIWAYWKTQKKLTEREEAHQKKLEEIANERLAEARADTEQVMEALSEASHAVKDFKVQNDALRMTIDMMAKSVERCQLGRGGTL